MSPRLLLGAAAIAVSALASPAFAQGLDPVRCTGPFPDPNCQSYRAGSPAAGSQYRHRRMAQRDWPATAAGAVVGAAVGTAAAVATAPVRAWDDSYASYDRGGPGWYGDWNSYAARNGIVCRPGTYFKGAEGRQHLCQ
ncbi:hypothetical protein [Bradyrhizobium liaoningense]|uniref:hypothetical protein n=1 Tax=Bradyrhizobium liaoningense TaxID=43992 RepID=UPI001BAA9AD9|nr:hypothetical protein [Bradyrhizobium liaoningense]MBR0718940.1 hypothetical protein [Bradyrhizobium liaoningense]